MTHLPNPHTETGWETEWDNFVGGRTLHWFESENGKAITKAFIHSLLSTQKEQFRAEVVAKILKIDWEKLSDDGHTVLIPKVDVLAAIKETGV